MGLERVGLDGNNGKSAEWTVVKSTNWSRNDSDLCLRQPTDQKAGGSNPSRRATKRLQNRYSHRKTLILSEFFLFLWVKFYFSVCTYKKDIFLNTDSNSHKVATFKEHRINYAPFCFCRSTYDFFETIPNKPLLNLEKY